eukprot:3559421-Pleurochrysis_carterae.AAC.2
MGWSRYAQTMTIAPISPALAYYAATTEARATRIPSYIGEPCPNHSPNFVAIICAEIRTKWLFLGKRACLALFSPGVGARAADGPPPRRRR